MLGICRAAAIAAQENFLFIIECSNDNINGFRNIGIALFGNFQLCFGTCFQRILNETLAVNECEWKMSHRNPFCVSQY